jgi:hypothetical protein
MTDTAPALIQGEFFTDGKTFVFKLAGTPLSGTGATPEAAYNDLMRVQGAAGDLNQRLRDLAREQRGEATRASVIRMTAIAMIAFGVVGAALIGGGALAPKVIADVAEVSSGKMATWVDSLTPEQEQKFARIFGGKCAPAEIAPPPAKPE